MNRIRRIAARIVIFALAMLVFYGGLNVVWISGQP